MGEKPEIHWAKKVSLSFTNLSAEWFQSTTDTENFDMQTEIHSLEIYKL